MTFPLFLKKRKKDSAFSLSIIFCMIISILIIVLDKQNLIKSSIIRNQILTIIFSTKDILLSSLPNFSKHKEYFVSKKELIFENEILQRETKEIGLWELKAKRLEIENNILKKELSLAPAISDKFITAKILIDTESIFTKSIIINVGKNMGVQVGQAATTSKGLIGSIVEVYDNYSRVLLITDINSKIPVSISEKNKKAILSGKNKNKLEFAYFQGEEDIEEDQLVFTSGDGGYFNSGIPIGVINIENGKVYVVPMNNFDELQYLQIFINNFKNF